MQQQICRSVCFELKKVGEWFKLNYRSPLKLFSNEWQKLPPVDPNSILAKKIVQIRESVADKSNHRSQLFHRVRAPLTSFQFIKSQTFNSSNLKLSIHQISSFNQTKSVILQCRPDCFQFYFVYLPLYHLKLEVVVTKVGSLVCLFLAAICNNTCAFRKGH